MPSDDPIAEDRQRLAFDFLKQATLEAHQEGDGLRVNLLCRTALDGIDDLVKDGQLKLSLSYLRWVFVFQFYWLVDYFTGQLASETMKKMPRLEPDDDKMSTFLECHQFLIQQPLSGLQPAFEMLSGLSVEIFVGTTHPALEDDVLLTHLGELAWFRSAGSNEWRVLLEQWQQTTTSWVVELASVLHRRLEWQTRMVVPSASYPIVDEPSIREIAESFELADLWLLHLHGRREAVVKRVQELSPTLTPDSYRWRIVSDFWHIDRRFGPLDSIEGQGRWLARRRSLTASSPLLQFHDRRETRIAEKVGLLFRNQLASNAVNRRDALQLAMLHELAALRFWDYGMWCQATEAQSEVWLEASLWMPENPGIVVHGLLLGARASTLKSSSKDSLTRKAIERLEFASTEVLLSFTDQLLASYPIQKYCASELIDEIADLFPSETWERLAEWTAAMAREMTEKRSTGEKMGPAKFWWKILPSVANDSRVWDLLLPEALAMAQVEFCWDGDRGAFLRRWIEHAPLALATQVGDAIIQVVPTQNILSLHRAELLAEAEEGRPELGRIFTSRLPRPAPSHEERLFLADDVDATPDPAETNAAREVYATKLAERIRIMTSLDDETKETLPFERLGLHRVDKWEARHQPLFDKLMAALHHPQLTAQHACELLYALQSIIMNGPLEFARAARSSVALWVKEPPSAAVPSQNEESPFSTFHHVRHGLDDVREALGWVVFQYLLIEGEGAADLIEEMSSRAIRNHWREPVGILCRCLVVLASKLPLDEGKEKLVRMYQMLDVLRAQIKVDRSAISAFAESLAFILGLVGTNRSQWIDWESDQGKMIATVLMDCMKVMLPDAAQSPSPILRIRAACILSCLQTWHPLSGELKVILGQLANDNRARVRWLAALSDGPSLA